MKEIIKKVLLLIKKVFLKPEVERHTHCIECGGKLTGNQRKFCGDVCNNAYWRKYYSERRKHKLIKIFNY